MANTNSMTISTAVKDELWECKSVKVYNTWIERYQRWKEKEELTDFVDDGNAVLNFMVQMKENYQASTLWQGCSALKKWIKLKNGPDISNCQLLKDFLKKCSSEHNPKKAAVFDEDALGDFIVLADASSEMIVWMVVAIISVHGALRVSEVANLTFMDVEDKGDKGFQVWIRSSKTDKAAKGWAFMIIPDKFTQRDPVKVIRKYISLVPESSRSGRFIRMFRSGKIIKTPVGKNTLGLIPRKIAEFLKLDDPQEYTGHSFRRTSATILANSGATHLDLKRHGRWKSDKVAEEYIAESDNVKIKTSGLISSSLSKKPKVEEEISTISREESTAASTVVNNITMTSCSGTTLQLHFQ
jgi:hypothetical protein